MQHNFAILGVGGYIAPRHLKAIHDTGNRLVAACDPKDAVGVLDQYSFEVNFFTEYERFDRHLEKLRRSGHPDRIDYLTVCSPNHLHDAHCRLGLRLGADVICEKPLVLNPWNLDLLQELESESKKRIYTVLQLRAHPTLRALKERIQGSKGHDICLSYVTARGNWYDYSWKGSADRSGGVATNIGIHFFDLLIWLFGPAHEVRLHLREKRKMAGILELERARVRWFLSVDKGDLPFEAKPGQQTTFRSITVDGEEIEFTEGFTDLHTLVYQEMLAGRGFGLEEARPSIKLVHELRNHSIAGADDYMHPFLKR